METKTQTNTYEQQKQIELNNAVNRLLERVENRQSHYENMKKLSIEAKKEAKARKRQEKENARKVESWKEHKYKLPNYLELPEDQPKVNKWEFIERVNANMILWLNKDNGCKSCFYSDINPNSIYSPGLQKRVHEYYYMNIVGDLRAVEDYGKFEGFDD